MRLEKAKTINLKHGNLLKKSCDEFKRAARLIETLDDDVYKSENIGAHFRHNFDFACNFLNGLRKGKVDYAKRERDGRIEQNREYAISQILRLVEVLQNLPDELFAGEMAVRSEIDGQLWHKSSAARELEFLYSHTVHHHAIIAVKLKTSGLELSADFGVASSTLEFWEGNKPEKVRAAQSTGAK